MALFAILDFLLQLLGWLIIFQVILSWLLVFNVLNASSGGLRAFIDALARLTEPLYRPIRKLLPDFGGIDFSPLVVLILIYILRMLLGGLATDLAYASL